MKTYWKNKRIKLEFDVIKEFEAGIILKGWEVKSVKDSKVNFSGSYIKPIKNELYLTSAKIIPMRFAKNVSIDEQEEDRKLLLNKQELNLIIQRQKESRLTIVPIELYENNRKLIKLKIGIAKGTKKYEKKDKIKRRDLKRSLEIDRKHYNI